MFFLKKPPSAFQQFKGDFKGAFIAGVLLWGYRHACESFAKDHQAAKVKAALEEAADEQE